MKTKITLLLCLFAFLAILPLSAAKYYLYASTDSNPWGAPADGTVTQVTGTLNTTINSYLGTDVVWIAKGTYNVDGSIVLANGIQVYGGFSGTETTLNDRQLQDADNGVVEPWEFKNPTTIYGVGFTGTAVSYPIVNSGTNSYTLNGIILEGHNTTNEKGGAIYTNARPTIEKCIIRNINQTASTAANGGAGIYTEAQGGAYIYSCLIENCVTNYNGAAIFGNRKVTIKGCVIRNNYASTTGSAKGGAIYLSNGGDTPNITNIVNNVIYNNTAASQGGAISLAGYDTTGPLNIINNTIVNNVANSSTGGVIGMRVGVVGTPGTLQKYYNNVIYNNYENGTILKNLRTSATTGTIDLQYCAYNAGTTVAVGGALATTGNLSTLSDPAFVSPSTTKGFTAVMPADVKAANFALQSNSALKDYGQAFSGISPSNDILGSTRPTVANKMDIGAYEGFDQNISYFTDNTDINVSRGGNLTIDAVKTLASIAVAPGAKLTIGNEITLTTTNGITLQSDASGTATMLNSGTYTGTVIAEQYLSSARNWYVSSPVQTTNSPANNITRYYEYVEAGNNNELGVTGSTVYWKGWNVEHAMTVGKGYIAQASAGTTVQFSGTPNNGNITTSFNLTRDDAKGKGFNLVGNPYPSYIDWSLVAQANTYLMSTAWFKTKKTDIAGAGYTFASVNVTTPSSPEIVSNNANTTITKYIPPTQAFWVRVKSGNATTTMSFTNEMREHRLSSGDLMKAPKVTERKRLRLQLVNGTETDETLIYFDSNATNDFNDYDSPKMMNNSSTTPDLYTKASNERLVINGLNEVIDNLELPLGFSLNAAATLKLKATEMSNFAQGTRIYLLDKAQNTQTELTPETEYSFSTSTTTSNNESRFSLIFRAPGSTTGVENAEKLNEQVFVNAANQITIIAPEKGNYAIFNAMGQLIENGVLNYKLHTINCKLNTGVYFVTLSINGQSEIQKVIIR